MTTRVVHVPKDALGTYATISECASGTVVTPNLYVAWNQTGCAESGYVQMMPETARLVGVALIESAARCGS